LILPRLSDRIGRRKVALFGNILHFIACFWFLWNKEVNFSLFLMFLIGLAMAARAFVGFLFMTENMRIKDYSYATASMFTIDSLGILISSLYFKSISKDWRGLFGIPLIF
jgi:MFS family permease